MTTLTQTQIRRIIRDHAKSRSAGYRILQSDEVHYYGRLPNSAAVGWYFVAYNAGEHALTIQADAAIMAEFRAAR